MIVSGDNSRSIIWRESRSLGKPVSGSQSRAVERVEFLVVVRLWDIFIASDDLVPHLLKCMNSEMSKSLVGDFRLLTQNNMLLLETYIMGRSFRADNLDL